MDPKNAILDRVREAAEAAAAEGVVRGAGEALHLYGPEVLAWAIVAVAAGIVLGNALARLFGLKGKP